MLLHFVAIQIIRQLLFSLSLSHSLSLSYIYDYIFHYYYFITIFMATLCFFLLYFILSSKQHNDINYHAYITFMFLSFYYRCNKYQFFCSYTSECVWVGVYCVKKEEGQNKIPLHKLLMFWFVQGLTG